MTYRAPIAEQSFVLETIGDLPGLARFPQFSALNHGIANAILEEGSRLTEGIFAPLNRKGDTEGLIWSPDCITHPDGFAEAYASYVEGGWGGLSADPQFGGQGLPFTLALAFSEQFGLIEHGLLIVHVAHRGRDGGYQRARFERAKGVLSTEAHLGPLDGNDESHRASSRIGCGGAADCGDACGRWQ